MDETFSSGVNTGNKITSVLMIVAVVAVVASVVGVIANWNAYKEMTVTGNVANVSGTAEVDIQAAVHIRYLVNQIHWGIGSVNSDPAELQTTSAPYYNGSWTPAPNEAPQDVGSDGTVVSGGLELENYGSVPVDLYLYFEDDASTFICGTGPEGDNCRNLGVPQVNWSLENVDPNSCSDQASYPGWSGMTTPSFTAPGDLVCDYFNESSSSNVIEIDLRLQLPITTPQGSKQNILYAGAIESI